MPRGIAYFRNGLGNFVMAMPGLQATASLCGGKIDMCLDDSWRDSRRPAVELILRKWEVVDKVIIFPRQKLNAEDYQVWFFSNHGERGDAAELFLPRVGQQVPRVNWRRTMMHEVDYCMRIAQSLGYRGGIPAVKFPVDSGPELGLPRPIVGLCNGAFRTKSGIWEKKRWPHFPRLATCLRHFLHTSVVGIGFAGELPGVALDRDYLGKLDIMQTGNVIKQLDLLVTTDTGNMHVTDLLGVPMVALFGSTLTSKNGPRGKNSIILSSGIECAPCQETTRFANCSVSRCMQLISVGDVMSAIQTLRTGENR